MRFKVGEKVRVREDLEVGKDYGGQRFTEDMNKYKGEIATISYINEFYKLYIGNPCWYWTDEMLEPVEIKNCDNCANRVENFYCKAVNCYMPNLEKWKPIEEIGRAHV